MDAFKFECCQSDDSLVIYNYTNTSCSDSKNVIRISNDYNDTCMNVGEDYNLVVQWTCSEYINCDSIPFFDGLSILVFICVCV